MIEPDAALNLLDDLIAKAKAAGAEAADALVVGSERRTPPTSTRASTSCLTVAKTYRSGFDSGRRSPPRAWPLKRAQPPILFFTHPGCSNHSLAAGSCAFVARAPETLMTT